MRAHAPGAAEVRLSYFLTVVSPGSRVGGNAGMCTRYRSRTRTDGTPTIWFAMPASSSSRPLLPTSSPTPSPTCCRDPNGAWANARDPKPFLFGAVANRARMHHRTNGRRNRREATMARRRRPAVTVDDHVEVVPDAFAELSVQQRAVTYLTYWHDLSVTEVAEILGIGDGTVRRQLARARSRLRGALS